MIKEANFVYVCGNGGSSATAEHFTNDLFSKGIKAVCLSSNMAIMTMIANDFGYEHVFSRQLNVYANDQDLVVIFSCSGNSDNVVEAFFGPWSAYAFVGKGGKLAEITDHIWTVNSDDYKVIEDEHLRIAHKISKAL